MFTEGFLNYFSKQLIYFSICFCKIYKKKSYLQNNLFPTHISNGLWLFSYWRWMCHEWNVFLKEIFSAICHLSNGFNDKIFKKTEKSWQDGSLGKDACDSMVQAWSFVWSVSVSVCMCVSLSLSPCVCLYLSVCLYSLSLIAKEKQRKIQSP